MRLISRLYRSIMYVYRFLGHVAYITSPAFRVADNWRERASIAAFILKWVMQRFVAIGSKALLNSILQEDTPVLLQGTRFYFGLNSSEIGMLGDIYLDHSYDEVEDFSSQQGWIIVDVGANAGLFSVYTALRGADVYAFEPNPACYRRLAKTITANGLQGKIKTFNYALARQSGTGTMIIPGGYTPGGYIVPTHDGAASDQAVTFPITSLDQIIPTLGISHIDLLKIDTEGAEAEVLAGAKQSLEQVERVVLEYHSRDLLEQTEGILRDKGFSQLRRVDQDTVAVRGVLYAWRSKDGESRQRAHVELEIGSVAP